MARKSSGAVSPPHRIGAGGNLPQLFHHCSPAPLQGLVLPDAVEGEVAGDFPKECLEQPRAAGRHGVPGAEIGVVDALLGVLGAFQDIPGMAAQ